MEVSQNISECLDTSTSKGQTRSSDEIVSQIRGNSFRKTSNIINIGQIPHYLLIN